MGKSLISLIILSMIQKGVNHNKVGRYKAKSLIVKMPAKRIKTLLIRLRTRPDPGATSAVLKHTGLNIAN